MDEGRLFLGGGSLDWEEHHGSGIGPSREQIVCDCVRLKRAGFLLAVRASRLADLGEEKAQQVGNFGRRADRRTSRAHLILLFDGNGRPHIENAVDIRASDFVEKHPGIGRERLDIPPLTFGEDRVEGERRFPRPRHAGNGRHLVVGNLQRDVLEVVLPGTLDDEVVG